MRPLPLSSPALQIARRIAEAMGGSLVVISAGVGKGSEFRLTLPWRPVGAGLGGLEASPTLNEKSLSGQVHISPLDFLPSPAPSMRGNRVVAAGGGGHKASAPAPPGGGGGDSAAQSPAAAASPGLPQDRKSIEEHLLSPGGGGGRYPLAADSPMGALASPSSPSQATLQDISLSASMALSAEMHTNHLVEQEQQPPESPGPLPIRVAAPVPPPPPSAPGLSRVQRQASDPEGGVRAAARAAVQCDPERPFHLLVAEDDPLSQKMITKILEKARVVNFIPSDLASL